MGFMNLFGKREKEENSTENVTESTENAAEGATTPEEQAAVNHDLITAKLMKEILIEIGCQPEEKDGNILEVGYQGEQFVIEFRNNYTRIWDLGWTYMKEDDPNWPNLRAAINHTNYDFSGATVVYTTPNDEGFIALHSHCDFLLVPMIPELPLYVKNILETFFILKKRVMEYYYELRKQQHEESKKRRPVGFDTNTTEEGA